MAMREDPFEGQMTPGDVRSLANADKKQTPAPAPQAQKPAPTAKKAVKSFAAVTTSEPDKIVINPVVKNINEDFTRTSDKVVLLNGRMNPVTKGHEENVQGMHAIAKENDADHLLLASHSHDVKKVGSDNKNPLSPEQKLKHLKRAFPNTNITTTSKEAPSILHTLAHLHKQGYKHVILAAGGDRVDDASYDMVHKYNGAKTSEDGKPLRHGYYNFDSIKIQSTGERKEGVSGTDMRKYAAGGDFKSFKSNLPEAIRNNATHAKDLFADVRNGMKINEHTISEKDGMALYEKALKNGIKPSVIEQVYVRGLQDWSDQNKQTPEQHAFARVNSFIGLGEAYQLDSDLRDIDEAADLQSRLKRKVTMAKYRKKIERAREIASKRFAKNKNLRARALKIARNQLRKRLAGARGSHYAKLDMQSKISVDKMLDKRRKQIKNIANKIITRVKRDEAGRLSGTRTGTAKMAIVASYQPTSLKAIVESVKKVSE